MGLGPVYSASVGGAYPPPHSTQMPQTWHQVPQVPRGMYSYPGVAGGQAGGGVSAGATTLAAAGNGVAHSRAPPPLLHLRAPALKPPRVGIDTPRQGSSLLQVPRGPPPSLFGKDVVISAGEGSSSSAAASLSSAEISSTGGVPGGTSLSLATPRLAPPSLPTAGREHMSAEAAAKAAKEEEAAAKAAAQEGRIKEVDAAMAAEEAEKAKSKLLQQQSQQQAQQQTQQQTQQRKTASSVGGPSQGGFGGHDSAGQSGAAADASRGGVVNHGTNGSTGVVAAASPLTEPFKGGQVKTSPTNGKAKPKLIFSGAGEVSMEERRAMLAKYQSPGKKRRRTAAKA